MTTALIVFLNVFFIAFVLVTVLGLLAWGIVSDRTIRASIADQRARLRGRAAPSTPRVRRRRRAGSPAAPSTSAHKSAQQAVVSVRAAAPSGAAVLFFAGAGVVGGVAWRFRRLWPDSGGGRGSRGRRGAGPYGRTAGGCGRAWRCPGRRAATRSRIRRPPRPAPRDRSADATREGIGPTVTTRACSTCLTRHGPGARAGLWAFCTPIWRGQLVHGGRPRRPRPRLRRLRGVCVWPPPGARTSRRPIQPSARRAGQPTHAYHHSPLPSPPFGTNDREREGLRRPKGGVEGN